MFTLRFFLFCFCCLCWALPRGNAQEKSVVDSLERLIALAPNDSTRCKYYDEICDYLAPIDNEQRGTYARKMLALAERKNPDGSVSTLLPTGRADGLFHLGQYHYQRSEYAEAFRFFSGALPLYEQLGRQTGVAAILSSIAGILVAQEQWGEAEAYYLRSKAVYESIGSVKGVRIVLVNFGAMLGYQDRTAEALDYYLQAEKTFTDPDDHYGLSTIFSNIGLCYGALKQPALARAYLEKARAEYERSGEEENLALLYIDLGNLDLDEDHYTEALEHYQVALTTAKAIGRKEQIEEACNLLASVHLHLGEAATNLAAKDSLYGKAFEYNQLARLYADSVLNADRSRQLTELQVQYETEKQIREISQLSAEATSRQIALLRQEVELRQRRLEADRAREQAALLEKTNANFALDLKVKEANLREQHAESQRKQQEIELLNEKNAAQEAATRRERALTLGLSLGLAAFALMLLLLLWFFRERGRAYRAIAGQNREIERQRQEIEMQNHRLEEAGAYKNAFFSNLSHEIRTPLNTVINVAGLLADTPLEERQRNYAEAIRHASTNLLGLINDILDFSKIEAGKLDLRLEPVNLADLLQRQVSMLRYSAAEHGLTLELDLANDLPPAILADATRLNQILLNLVGNALKFTERGGSVTVACVVRERLAEEKVVLGFSVQDTGIGIAPDKLAHIFDAFVQADADTHTRYGGTGLGLTITKQLVELQGGTLSAESTLGKGSIFRFTLPASRADFSSENTVTPSQPLKKLPACRILLVEDNLFNQQLARELLERLVENPYIALAANGAEALDKAAAEPFDLVLMDVRMPVMDGFVATRSLRERGLTTPIIALTANATTEEEAKCRAAGMDDYLSKPIDVVALREKVGRWSKIQ